MPEKKYFVLPYRSYSKGAKALADALGGKRLKPEGSLYKPFGNHVVINWGNTSNLGHPALTKQVLNQYVANVFNLPEDILRASNKKTFFRLMQESCSELIPRFWTDMDDIPDDAFPVVCRTVLSGHSGEGIVIANNEDELVTAPLYVQYVKKKEEYRVHVGSKPDGSLVTIAVQQKRRRTDVSNPNWQVRNHQNGFVYARSNVNPPACVVDAALATFKDTCLDFGAVDVIWNQQSNKAYVLEVNTAPGLEGQTILDYKEFFKNA